MGDFAKLSLILSLEWELGGRVFIEGTNYQKSTKKYAADPPKELYRYEVGVSELGGDNFSDLSNEMRDTIDSFRLCGPIGATQYANLCPKEIMIDPEKVKQRIDRDAKVVKEAAKKAGAKAKQEIGKAVDKVKDKLEDVYDKLFGSPKVPTTLSEYKDFLRAQAEQVLNPLKTLNDSLGAIAPNPGSDVNKVKEGICSSYCLTGDEDNEGSAWFRTATVPDDQATFATQIVGDVLYVAWIENHSYNLYEQEDDLAATLRVDYENGKFIVDGVDYITYMPVAQHLRYNPSTNSVELVDVLHKEVVFPNRIEINATGISRISIQGSSRSDTIIAAPNLNVPVTISGLAGDDYLQGTSFSDTLLGGPGNDTLLGRAGNDDSLKAMKETMR